MIIYISGLSFFQEKAPEFDEQAKSADDGSANVTSTDEENVINDSTNVTFECYDNYTVYYPLYESAKFWIEGVLLIGVGIFGLFGNCLTLAVLSQSKRSTFNQLLIVMSVIDSLLIVFFILMSACTTVTDSEPDWFIYLFPYLLWPLGNISITSTVLMVAAVSTERYLAICRYFS